MPDPVVAQPGPIPTEVQAGQVYFWCTCGLSAKQPFCDAAHMGQGFYPMMWRAEATEVVQFCGCKHSTTKPLCDGVSGACSGAKFEAAK